MKLLPLLIMVAMMMPPFAAISSGKTKKKGDANPTVVVIKDGVKKTIPFSQTEKLNPDSVESVSVNNDTLFIRLKSVKKATAKRTSIKK